LEREFGQKGHQGTQSIVLLGSGPPSYKKALEISTESVEIKENKALREAFGKETW
jgi:hypothetical protein